MEWKNHVLKNTLGTEIHITNFGGIITRLLTMDKQKNAADIVLGYDRAEEYEKQGNSPYLGAIIGRFANRIAKGRFTLSGKVYQLALNSASHALHGGLKGFDKVFWDSHQVGNVLSLTSFSRDGEEGYPGNLNVRVTYELTERNELSIHYEATTDQATPLNLTQHSYFNLSGNPQSSILDHELQIHAKLMTEVDQEMIPTGKLIKVHGTEMDFTTLRKIEKGIYDHNFVLHGSGWKLAATLIHRASGRKLEVLTTEPGLQFYTGNFLDGKNFLKNSGLCLETQHFPDSPNHPEFPSTILEPGKIYQSTTHYVFSVI